MMIKKFRKNSQYFFLVIAYIIFGISCIGSSSDNRNDSAYSKLQSEIDFFNSNSYYSSDDYNEIIKKIETYIGNSTNEDNIIKVTDAKRLITSRYKYIHDSYSTFLQQVINKCTEKALDTHPTYKLEYAQFTSLYQDMPLDQNKNIDIILDVNVKLKGAWLGFDERSMYMSAPTRFDVSAGGESVNSSIGDITIMRDEKY